MDGVIVVGANPYLASMDVFNVWYKNLRGVSSTAACGPCTTSSISRASLSDTASIASE